MTNMKSKVCTMANALVKKGYTKSAAFTKAWALVKAEAAARNQKFVDAYNRAEEIKFELSYMVRKGQMNSDSYKTLRAELATLAA